MPFSGTEIWGLLPPPPWLTFFNIEKITSSLDFGIDSFCSDFMQVRCEGIPANSEGAVKSHLRKRKSGHTGCDRRRSE